MDTKERARLYFRLGEQYAEAAKLLLVTLINNGNSNAGIGKTPEDALREMEKNSTKSDLYLFAPAVFNCLQCTELFIKGLLLLSGKEFKKDHGVEELIEVLRKTYPKDVSVNVTIKAFYENQISIIEEFRQTNCLLTSKDLYMSLRYPEIVLKRETEKENVTIDYSALICNGDVGIEQFNLLADSLEAVRIATVKEYHTQCSQ